MKARVGHSPKLRLNCVRLVPQLLHRHRSSVFEMIRQLVKTEYRPQESHFTSVPKAALGESEAAANCAASIKRSASGRPWEESAVTDLDNRRLGR